MEQEIIVGLDIGTTKIACFVGIRGNDESVKILGFGRTSSAGVEHGVVKNVIDAAASIRRAVDEAAEQANVNIEEVWVGIAGQHINSRSLPGSIMIPSDHELITEEDVEHLTNDQYNTMLDPGEEIIHIFPQQYYVDHEALSRGLSPVGVAGKTLTADFHMVTGNVQHLRYIRMAVEQAGLKIKGVVLEPIASSRAVLDDADRDAGVAMVDIGGGTTDIAVFHNRIIRHTSVLPVAGNAITNDIFEGCSIRWTQAESLKIKFGSCLVQAVSDRDVISIPGIRSQPATEIHVKTLATIINARARMIMEQINYEIKLSGYSRKLIAGVVLTGGGAQLKNIKDLCELITGTPTRIGIPNEHLDPDSVCYQELIHPMYATGIGLVLYGLDKAEHGEPEPEPEEKQKEQPSPWKNDIFASMPDSNKTQPETPPIEEPKTKTAHTEEEKEKDGFMKRVNSFLGKIFNEHLDD